MLGNVLVHKKFRSIVHNMNVLRTYNVKFYLNNNQNQLNDFEILNTCFFYNNTNINIDYLVELFL